MDEYLACCLVMLASSQDGLSASQELTHDCPICGKGFSSHQALGGHMSSHRKPGVRTVSVSSLSSVASGVSSSGTGVHKCNICHKAFATGQALGGHKRKHYLEGGPSTSFVGVRDFDLNLPAPSEIGSWLDEDDELQSPSPLKKDFTQDSRLT